MLQLAAIVGLVLLMAPCWTGCQSDPEPGPGAGPGTNPEKVYKGHDRQRLRGCMVMNNMKTADVATLGGEWKANLVRWPFMTYAPQMTIPEYKQWINGQCALLDAVLPELKKHNMLVCIDLHDPPGQRRDSEGPDYVEGDHNNWLFYDKKYQDAFIEVWEDLARRYKDNPTIWAYDLTNEPGEGNMPKIDELLDWYDLALKTIKAIRKIDPEKAIVVEALFDLSKKLPPPYDKDEAPNVVYSFHMYEPLEITHQTLASHWPGPATYPGYTNWQGKWDKTLLHKRLQPLIAWSRTNKVHIYVGEFSCIRWAPDNSAFNYLRDCIELFEELGWDWSYHAFREWHGWSVEHDTNKNNENKVSVPTDRELLLKKWFKKNE